MLMVMELVMHVITILYLMLMVMDTQLLKVIVMMVIPLFIQEQQKSVVTGKTTIVMG